MRTSMWALLVLVLAATGCQSPMALSQGPNTRDRLADWMTGSFSSAAQAAEDEDFYDIRLHMARIWTDRTDGVWLCVEQAVATAMDRPYRQRV